MQDTLYMKRQSRAVKDTFAEVGASLKTWRMLYKLKAVQVAERAGISLGTLHKIEKGDPSISVGAFLEVLNSLGLLESFSDSLDPLNSDLGRMRINENMPKRIR